MTVSDAGVPGRRKQSVHQQPQRAVEVVAELRRGGFTISPFAASAHRVRTPAASSGQRPSRAETTSSAMRSSRSSSTVRSRWAFAAAAISPQRGHGRHTVSAAFGEDAVRATKRENRASRTAVSCWADPSRVDRLPHRRKMLLVQGLHEGAHQLLLARPVEVERRARQAGPPSDALHRRATEPEGDELRGRGLEQCLAGRGCAGGD